MASSNIKLFDENKGNMLTDNEFNISTQRLNGLQTGVASSQLQNKAMYQASLVAYAIAQVMMQNGKNANDTDAVSAFVANLSGTMLQKVYDIATTAEAQAGVATGKWMSPALVKAAIDTLAAKAQNILSDETKTLLGLGKYSVPDDAFTLLKNLIDSNYSELSSLVNSKAKTVAGSYVGTGDNMYTRTLNCGFNPKLVIIVPSNAGFTIANSELFRTAVLVQGLSTASIYSSNFINVSWSTNGVSFVGQSSESYGAGMNERGVTYLWVAIG